MSHLFLPKSGKPMVKVAPLTALHASKMKRLGWMVGQMRIPADFDSLGKDEVAQLFYGEKCGQSQVSRTIIG